MPLSACSINCGRATYQISNGDVHSISYLSFVIIYWSEIELEIDSAEGILLLLFVVLPSFFIFCKQMMMKYVTIMRN